MITALILNLIHKYRIFLQQHTKTGINAAKIACIASCFIIVSFAVHPQEQFRQYSIIYKGDKVGTMQYYQRVKADTSYFKIISDVKMRFLFQVAVFSMEESYFNNGRMTYSNFFRDVNGTRKASRQTRAANNNYQAYADGKQVASYPGTIEYNVAHLYCQEPVNIRSVYSDAFQQFLVIEKVENHKYKIRLPDGNYNHYSYLNGICYQIDVHQALYDLQIVMN